MLIEKIIEDAETLTEEQQAELAAKILNLGNMPKPAWEKFYETLDDDIKEELIGRFQDI